MKTLLIVLVVVAIILFVWRPGFIPGLGRRRGRRTTTANPHRRRTFRL